MAVNSQKNYVGDVVVFEEDVRYSRETGTLASGNGTVEVGAVLGVITASGKYAPYDDGTAADGRDTAVAICLEEADTSGGDKDVPVLVRHAVVNRQNLVWDSTIDTSGERDTGVSELADVGIIAREGA